MNTRDPRRGSAVHGVVAIDKPSGPTSFDVVAQVRRTFQTKAVGHAGTLDPLATGVLVVMLGEATKLSEYLTAQDKEYVTEIRFGRSTDTLDVTGTTTEERALTPDSVRLSAIEHAVEEERKRQWQLPPAHSAIKVAGERAYSLARRGQSFELLPRSVVVTQLAIEAFDGATVTLRLRVSKGYYVRALVRDICDHLGVPGCMSALRRTRSGNFHVEGCVEWPPSTTSGAPTLMSLSEAVKCSLPWGVLTPEGVLRARHGKRLGAQHFTRLPKDKLFAWLDHEQKLIALGEQVHTPDEAELEFRVLRGFSEQEN